MNASAGVTIVIPNWNHELVLPRSIASALRSVSVLRAQGLPAEVLVIDDASRDGSCTLLRQLEMLHRRDGLRVLPFGANGGLVATRNQAIRNARYRYVAFLDADNELIPENLPVLVRTLQETDAAAAYGNLLTRSTSAEAADDLISNEEIQGKIFNGNYVDAFALFDRLQLMDVGGYEPTYPTWADFELWLHEASNGRNVIFVPIVLGYYYVLPNSMSADDLDRVETSHAHLRRVFNQTGSRTHMPMRTDQSRFHPAVGYL